MIARSLVNLQPILHACHTANAGDRGEKAVDLISQHWARQDDMAVASALHLLQLACSRARVKVWQRPMRPCRRNWGAADALVKEIVPWLWKRLRAHRSC